MFNNSTIVFEQFLKEKIPIAQSMAISIVDIGPLEITMLLLLAPNRNHKGTLFGGSLYSGAALACYGLFLYGLSNNGFSADDIVISEGDISYLKPVKSDALIIANWSDANTPNLFYRRLSKKGRARIPISAKIMEGDSLCAIFHSQFVAKIELGNVK
jgi:thioesterase domain-containing protein